MSKKNDAARDEVTSIVGTVSKKNGGVGIVTTNDQDSKASRILSELMAEAHSQTGPLDPQTEGADDVTQEAGSIKQEPPKKPNTIPSFIVNDESRVEVVLVSHQLQKSMARNNFTSSSFEVGG